MDYEKKYNDALSQARFYYGNCPTEPEKKKLEKLFPELRESEDETTRKELLDFVRSFWADHKEKLPQASRWVIYLEKQKNAFENGRQFGIMQEQARQELEWPDKIQKAQNSEDKECTDFTVYHPLRIGKGKYECIPYSFYGSLTSFSNKEDLINFLRTCFLTKEECNEWIKKQKEQKPAASREEILHQLFQNGSITLSDYLYLTEEPKSSWSEEDEDMLNCCISSIEEAKENRYAYKETDGDTSYDREIAFLKSLRPSWKPSDQDELMKLKYAGTSTKLD